MNEQQPHNTGQPAEGQPQDAENRNEHVGDVPNQAEGISPPYRDVEMSGADKPDCGEQEPRDRPRIWVGSWADYNNGILHGDWVAADRDDDSIWSDIQAMLARSPTTAQTGEVAEDWGIFDYDNFGPLRIGEQESVGWVTKVARGITEHGLAYAAYADVMEDEETLDGFEDAYLGHFDSLQAYAEQLVDDLGYERLLDEAVPESLRAYVQFDTAMLARDMQMGGDIHVIPAEDGGVWLFDARG